MESKTSKRRVRVRVGLIPADLLPFILELTTVKVNGEYVKVIPINLVVREALTRGLTQMTREKRAADLMALMEPVAVTVVPPS